jgi:hypothetical protein
MGVGTVAIPEGDGARVQSGRMASASVAADRVGSHFVAARVPPLVAAAESTVHTQPPASASPPAIGDATSWRMEGHRLRDPRGDAGAVLDLDAPQLGVRPHGSAAAGVAPPDQAAGFEVRALLGVDLRPSFRLADHWLRDADVTAAYESTDARRLRVTAMWRLQAADAGVRAWELILSAQTAVLQSDPRLSVVSRVSFPAAAGDASDCVWGTCGVTGASWSDSPTAQATAVLVLPTSPATGGAPEARSTRGDHEALVVVGHPGEVERLAVRRDGGDLVVEARLFGGDLEKGVLLRGRMLAAIGPAADAREWAGRLARALAAAAPMLST